MNAINIISEFYNTNSTAYKILVQHGRLVADKALNVANRLGLSELELKFIDEAAMLHDIGIFLVNAPEFDCFGKHPYICHGYLGCNLLRQKGFPKHALVCERHVGTGITIDDIQTNNLPLPMIDMTPVSLEEQIICYADKFFSKSDNLSSKEKSIKTIKQYFEKFGKDKVMKFQSWVDMFE